MHLISDGEKEAFLKKKGLSDEMIEEAFRIFK